MINIPNPVRVVCTRCVTVMRVHHQEVGQHGDSVRLALECPCGRMLAEVDGIAFRHDAVAKEGLVSSALVSISPDDVAAGGADRARRARELAVLAEQGIALATWAREKPRPA